MLTEDEASLCSMPIISLDKDGKRVYDMDMIMEEFDSNIENLIELNKQKGLA